MNRCHRVVLCLIVVWGACVLSAGAQSLTAFKNATAPLSAADKASVKLAIVPTIARLAQGAPGARGALIAETKNGPALASTFFLDAYAEVLVKALDPLITSADVRQRLNAAIVAAGVADAASTANSTSLEPVAIALLKDPSQPIVFWGMRVARGVLPGVLSNGLLARNSQLPAAILTAARQNAAGQMAGQIAVETYETIAPIPTDANAPAANPAVLSALVPLALSQFESRLVLYATGPLPQPAAENAVTSFLSNPKVWSIEKPEEKLRTVQALSNELSLASQDLQATSDATRKVELSKAIARTASAIWVVGDDVKSDAIKHATEELIKMETQNQVPVDRIEQLVPGVYQAIIQVKDFAGIKSPPKMTVPVASSQATTAETPKAPTSTSTSATAPTTASNP